MTIPKPEIYNLTSTAGKGASRERLDQEAKQYKMAYVKQPMLRLPERMFEKHKNIRKGMASYWVPQRDKGVCHHPAEAIRMKGSNQYYEKYTCMACNEGVGNPKRKNIAAIADGREG